MIPSSAPRGLRVDRSLDIRGLASPAGYQRAVDALQGMAEGGVLELYIDEKASLDTVPFGLRAEGHEILVSESVQEGVRLLIRKRAPAA